MTPRSSRACAAHGVAALLTSVRHASGSDRIAEASTALGLDDDEIVVNVQGDEPLIEPALIDACAALLAERGDCVMSTAAHAIDDRADFANAEHRQGRARRRAAARCTSRARRSPGRATDDGAGASAMATPPLRHVGLYAYRAGFLRRFPLLAAQPARGDRARSSSCACCGTASASRCTSATLPPGIGVDTAEDLARARRLVAGDSGAGFA